MIFSDKQVVTIEGERYVCTNVFEGETQRDILNVLMVDDTGLYVATLNRQPITNPVPKGVAFEVMMNRVQNSIQMVA